VRLLLDTQAVIWWFRGDADQFTDNTREVLRNELEVFISPISLLEIELKRSRGKLPVPEDFTEAVRSSDFRELPLRHNHAVAAGRLPDIHRDPFDRLLIAQAQCDNAALVTRDSVIPEYDVAVLAI
jgi:PIN domain nuclease of toxin-antitoxin system